MASSSNAHWRAERLKLVKLGGNKQHKSLQGTIPNAVCSWSEMEILRMEFTRLSGSLPEAVAYMSHMQALIIQLTFRLNGSLPAAVACMPKMRAMIIIRTKLNGSLPGALASMSKMNSLRIALNQQSGAIPIALGGLKLLKELESGNNQLRGALPCVLGSLAAMESLHVAGNQQSGTIPIALCGLTRLRTLWLGRNHLNGCLPDALGSLVAMHEMDIPSAELSGVVPDELASMRSLAFLDVGENKLSGSLPRSVVCLRALSGLSASNNRLCGSLPDGLLVLARLSDLDVSDNMLSGSIPDALAAMTDMQRNKLHENQLCGKVPDAFVFMTELLFFLVDTNRLSGTIPAAFTSLAVLHTIFAHDNMLSGSIPSLVTSPKNYKLLGLSINGNRLTGSLPALPHVKLLMASHNLLEGTLPDNFNSKLGVLDLAGVTGISGGLHGHFPSALRHASELRMMTIANHQMEGAIPSFTSTLSLLALHRNRFKVLPDLHFENNALKTVVLLHDNLLSCYAPWCGNVTARTSILAIGNRLRYPIRQFPAWVSQYEHDPLFWVADGEGVSLVKKIGMAACFYVVVAGFQLGRAKLLKAMSGWHIGPETHLWIVKASSHLFSYMARGSLFAVISLMFLLFWDLYACPQTLAIASACSRNSHLIRTFVFLCWCNISFHSLAVKHLTMEGEKWKKQQMGQTLRKRSLLWLLWYVLTLVLSTLNVVDQVSKSIPGFLPAGKFCSLGLKACIGAIQGLVGNVVVPSLASKVTWNKHIFTVISILIMNCFIPGVVIMYLDTGCLGRWVALWKPCRSSRQQFQYSLVCNHENRQGCIPHVVAYDIQHTNIDIPVLRSRDICDPHSSWTSTAMSRCMDISLLRLQEIWLTKFVTIGLVMPGVAIGRDSLPKEPGIVVGSFAIYAAYALMSSGHLPLMMPMLLLAFSGEGLVARVAWAEKYFKAVDVQNVAAPAVQMTRLLSLMLHLASVAGDPRTLAIAVAYISICVMAAKEHKRSSQEVTRSRQIVLKRSHLAPCRKEASVALPAATCLGS